MYKVFIIAHQFPPMGGAGVQRTSKFVKYLPEFGWESTVLTRDTANIPLKDDTLLKDIPKTTKIIRTKSFDLTNLNSFLHIPGKIIARKFLIPDSERLWQLFSKKEALKTNEDENFDFLYTTSSPYSDHLLGLNIKSKFANLPWVADFRDEWTNNPYFLDNPHNFIRNNIEKNMEKNILNKADAIITNSRIMKDNFIKNNQDIKNLKDKFYVIPNGYDQDDFKEIKTKHIKNKKFTITYTGALYGRRKPDIFFQSVSELISKNKLKINDLYIKLIGNFKEKELNEKIEKNKLLNCVKIYSYMSHDKVLEELNSSDCLLLIEGGGIGAEAFFTGKIFEYINAKKPILANIPYNGVAADLIRKTKTGLVSDFSDVETTKKNIIKLFEDFKEDKNTLNPNWDEIKKYERKNLTKSLVDIFNKYKNK
jgi:glycosyltransferase involved in cell wall biosynthesis